MTELTSLEQLNLEIAAIAGWTDIEVWQPERNLPIKTFQGVNLAHPELGHFVPNYVEDLNAIEKLLALLDVNYQVMRYGKQHDKVKKYFIVFEGFEPDYQDEQHPNYPWFDSLPFGLCKLLLAINPEPIKPQVKAEIVEASFG